MDFVVRGLVAFHPPFRIIMPTTTLACLRLSSALATAAAATVASTLVAAADTVATEADSANIEAALIPFVMPWDDASEGVTNLSAWNHKPAGKHGFVFVEDGHLYITQAKDGSGSNRERIRFFGVNLCYTANFPAKADAPKIATRLARFGINCVRFHHMDAGAAPGGLLSADLSGLDPAQLERLDYFVHCLREQGIYINLNLHVSRRYPDFPYDNALKANTRYFKGLDQFVPEMIDWQKRYARELLHHRNPHTGLRYADDPAVAFVEINNENGLFANWYNSRLEPDKLAPVFTEALSKLWNNWLARKYGSAENARAAWQKNAAKSSTAEAMKSGGNSMPVEIPRRRFSQNGNRAMLADWTRCLYETERDYYTDMRDFLRGELGVRSLVVGSQPGGSYSMVNVQAAMDVVDAHGYWAHPENRPDPLHPEWPASQVTNESLVNAPAAGPLGVLAQYRVAGKPFSVSEYNHSSPNTFSAEGFPLLAAFAALQDWDAIYAFAWSHGGAWDRRRIAGNFDIHQHPVRLATLPLAAALFRRGDLRAPVEHAQKPTDFPLESVLESILRDSVHRANAGRFGADRRDTLRAPVSLRLTATGAPATKAAEPIYTGAIRSEGGQLTWDANAPHGVVLIDTPHSKAVVGFANGRTFALGGETGASGSSARVTIHPGKTLQDWSVIGLMAKSDRDPGAPGEALLVACGYTQNTGMRWHDAGKSRLKTWGNPPTLIEGVPAEITLELREGATGTEVWSLDERGRRVRSLPVSVEEGVARFHIGPEFRTLWYEIVTQ
ncbi:hypothetical protein OPIT5_22980 [Opitutaceae bacterium TAV5]|nr:hypothetical protein OPIT5_22980 [Opitutaceae bacterium TAV5]